VSVELRHREKFGGDRSSIAQISQFLHFSRWPPPPSLIFFKLLTVGTVKKLEMQCITVPSLAEITRTAADICRFFDFSRWRQSAIFGFVVGTLGPPTRTT